MTSLKIPARMCYRSEIIETLLLEGDMSRANLAKKLKISKPAIADNVEQLIEEELVFEIGEGTSSPKGGRRPRLLRFNRRYRGIVVICLSGQHPIIAIGDLGGDILAETKLPVSSLSNKQQKFDLLITSIGKLIEDADNIEIGAIVITSPGLFSSDNKLIYAHKQHEWVDAQLWDDFTKYFDVPVIIKNDMSAAALGEFTLGNGLGCTDVVYVSCGSGLGAGIIIGGKLYEGKNYAAGEISFLTNRELIKNGESIEDRITSSAILKRIDKDIKANKASNHVLDLHKKKGCIDFEDIIALVNINDSYTTDLIIGLAEDLGIALVNISTVLDVERIVLGGDFLAFFETLKSPISSILTELLPFPPQFVPSALGNKVAIFGGLIFGRGILLQELNYTPL